MEGHSIIAVLSLAFGLGWMHALDADHIMAVSGLASTRPGLRTSLGFCARWALGHGLALLLIGTAVLGFGMAIPAAVSAAADGLVGALLIGIGVWVLLELRLRHAHLHFHHHDGLKQHAHWHVHPNMPGAPHRRDPHVHDHGAVLVGVLHGIAGSAPLLALIPLAKMETPALGMAYLLVFCLGVLFSMVLFGGLLGGAYRWLTRWGNRLVRRLRAAVAISAIGFGGFLLHGAL